MRSKLFIDLAQRRKTELFFVAQAHLSLKHLYRIFLLSFYVIPSSFQ